MDESVDKDKTWGWLKNGGLKGCTESLICAAQDQALRTNYFIILIIPLNRFCVGSVGKKEKLLAI